MFDDTGIQIVSLEESVNRRENLINNWLKKYNITNYTFHLFKRIHEYPEYRFEGPFINQIDEFSKGTSSTHLSALKKWYESTAEPYTLVFEDDISFETVQYWNFTWREFVDALPKNWNCIQLVVKKTEFYNKNFKFHLREDTEWSAAAYLIKREYVKFLLESYYPEKNIFTYDIRGTNIIPVVEQLLFLNTPYRESIYSFPLFVEDVYNSKTTNLNSNTNTHYSFDSYENVLSWWKEKGKTMLIDEILNLENFDWGVKSQEFIDFVSHEIFVDKVYEKFYDVKEGDIVVDVGASAGPFTYSILNKKPAHVYCIEPSKNFFAALSENAKGHPVTCINKAIVSKTHTSEDTKKLHVFWTDTLEGIETTTFKSFLSDNNIDSINMMKMDCEGGEYDILTEENLDFIINRVDNIAAEIHFVWNQDKLHHKFKHFRENILPKIPNYKLFSVEQDQASIAVDITDKIHIPNYVESRYNQIMLYVQKEPFAGTKGKRKIVDCFRFFNEKEMLELRYKMLSDVVDKFVVLEGTKTQSGNSWTPCARKFVQELNIPEEKFIFVETDLPGNDQYIENNVLDYIMRAKSGPSNDSYKNSLNARTRERLSIDGLLTVLDQFGNDDIFFVSDVDEIIKPTCVEYFADVASRNIHELIKVPLVELQGRANLRAHDRKTDAPLSTDNVFFIATKKHLARATPFQLRFNIENPFATVYITQDGSRLEDCGWHFSWMGDADRLKLKQKSTSHYADRIESSVIKDMDSQELQEYMENWNPKDNPMSLNTWGDMNTVLKKYDLSSLPKELLEDKHLASFFLQEEDTSLLQKEAGNEGQFSDWHNGYFIAVCKKSQQQKNRKPIPVMGVPVVNGLHWLRRLIDSIDYPVEELFIVNNNGKEELTEELDKIAKTPHKYVNKIKVTHLPHNLGCSGAWNLIIKCYMKSPYWLIVNNDVAFTPGLLEKMNDAALNTDAEMIHCKMSQWGSIKGGAYDLFLITQSAVQKCGLFDENLYPIYAEDVDYSIRLANENVKTLNLDINYLHGEKDYETSGSQTWRLDPTNLKDKMDNGRVMNETVYLYKKWGHDFYSNSPYSRPFNNENLDSRYTTYDLEFVRKKHLGF